MRRTVPTFVPSFAVTVLLAALAPGLAAADATDGAPPSSPSTPSPSRTPITVGARVGGYGFRHPGAVDDHGHVAWDACRMNGVGVFARRPLGRLFTEAGADLYFSESFPMATTPGEGDEDRMSGLLTAAIGADLVRTRHVVGYAQLGAGLELTKVSMTMADGAVHHDTRALPIGFIGIGGEVRLGARTALGFNLRTHVMGYFETDDGGWGHVHGAIALDAAPTDDIPVRPEVAAQGQFYVSYRL